MTYSDASSHVGQIQAQKINISESVSSNEKLRGDADAVVHPLRFLQSRSEVGTVGSEDDWLDRCSLASLSTITPPGTRVTSVVSTSTRSTTSTTSSTGRRPWTGPGRWSDSDTLVQRPDSTLSSGSDTSGFVDLSAPEDAHPLSHLVPPGTRSSSSMATFSSVSTHLSGLGSTCAMAIGKTGKAALNVAEETYISWWLWRLERRRDKGEFFSKMKDGMEFDEILRRLTDIRDK